MKSRLVLALAAAALCFNSCSTLYRTGDYFFARRGGADMPVWVTGNSDSGAMVLLLHGGPGGDASTASLFPAFVELEASYGLIYWDQRASGLSQGNPSTETFSVEEFVSDADLVIDLIR